jgi:hypothetical protein
MDLFKLVSTPLKNTGEFLENLAHRVQESYEKNATPTPSFVREVEGLSCIVRHESSGKRFGHPLFSFTASSSPWRAGLEAAVASLPGLPPGLAPSLLLLAREGENLIEERTLLLKGLGHLVGFSSAGEATEPDVDRVRLTKLAFLVARERRRVINEEGLSQAAPLLLMETHIALALGDSQRADQLSARLMETLKESATATALAPVQSLVESGELHAGDLEDLKPYFRIVSIPACGKKLAATPFFFQQSGPRQLEMLQEVSRLALVAEHRTHARDALLACDEPRQLYHEAHLALLSGNTPKARVLLMDFKENTMTAEDPELILMREEAREILRIFSLQEMDQLIAYNQEIAAQRKGNRYGWTIEAILTGESQDLSLQRMKKFLERGEADTLEEAYELGREAGILGKISGSLVPLFQMGTREGLERLSQPESRKRYLLEVVEATNIRDGSYAGSGKLLEDVFQDELRFALRECSKEKFAALRADIDRENLEKMVSRELMQAALEEKLALLQEKDPDGFAERFGADGPSEDEKKGLIDEMVKTEVEHRVTLLVGFHLLGELHDSGELKTRDPLAAQAWEIYNDSFDPLDEIFNVAHATSDVLKKEALFTVVTLPAGLGVGTLARAGVGGSSLVVRLAAQGGFRAMLAEGMVIGAGALAEGLTGLALNRLLKGEKITPGKAGLEFLSGLAGGSIGRLWSRGAKALKIDEAALETLVKKGGNRAELAGRKIGGFAAPLALSVANTTLFGEIGILFEDEPVKTSFAERLFGNFIKGLINPQLEKVVHRALGNYLSDADDQVWRRLKVAREGILVQKRMDEDDSHALFKMGQAASSLKEAGATEEEIVKWLEIDPSLAPLVMPATDDADALVKDLTEGFKK